jgi:hypothetical protein
VLGEIRPEEGIDAGTSMEEEREVGAPPSH